jgi:glycosyltransferase involved in cell wall biosynthesis
LAAGRLARLLRDHVDLLPVWLDAPTPSGRSEPHAEGLALAPPQGPGGLPWLARQLGRLEVDAYHLHGVFEYPLACLQMDAPVMASFRGSDLSLGVYRRPAELEMLLEKARVVTFMNEAQEKLARRLFPVSGQTMIVPNHVDDMQVVPATLDLPRPIIGCVAEFRRVTGLDLLLGAFVKLGRGTMLLVGPFHPNDAGYYSDWIDKLRGVHRTGAVSPQRVRELMAACDLMVFPSVSEGMPNKVLEAMATGTPVLVSDIAGNRQLVEDHQHGRLFTSRDSDHLHQVMLEMCQAPEQERQGWTESARLRVKEEFNAANELAGWLHCYRLAGIGRA